MHSLAGTEDGARGPAANECQQPRDSGKDKETPRAPKAHDPADTLILAPSEVNSTCDFGLPELEHM